MLNKIGKIVLLVILGIGLVFLFAFITQYLWNWLVPALFGGPVITFWQALGLLMLSKILFSGLGGRGGCYGEGSKAAWKHRVHDKLAVMTPEEREEFKKKMWEKWCPANKPEKDSAND